MNPLIYVGLGWVMLWLQVTLAGSITVLGIVPNFLLITVLLCGVRWLDQWQFVYAALAGLAMDVFSHGILGVYGLSFFLVSFAARMMGLSMYENNLLSTMMLVMGLGTLEGTISVTILQFLDSSVPWWRWILTKVIPASLYLAVLTPPFLWALERIEKRWGTKEVYRGMRT